jgi:hypothetical protein
VFPIESVDEIPDKPEAIKLEFRLLSQLFDILEAHLLELLVDLLLMLRGFSLDVQVEVDQEIPGLLFHLRELTVDRYAPESINTLQAV